MVSNFSITVSAKDTLSNIGGNSEETIQILLPNYGNEMNDLTPILESTAETIQTIHISH
ncbi:MAG: hypothetical protein K2K06_11805 [Oscillospiraceae bacterium]|nr:hypothetical protein [Oscillospiraceae bacterium]